MFYPFPLFIHSFMHASSCICVHRVSKNSAEKEELMSDGFLTHSHDSDPGSSQKGVDVCVYIWVVKGR
jgi:hypothetical protein